MSKDIKNKDITVILPIHSIKDNEKEMARHSIMSFIDCQEYYNHGTLYLNIVTTDNSFDIVTKEILDPLNETRQFSNVTVMKNDNGNFFEMVKEGIKCTDTEYFSILEFDDYYNKKWFDMWYKYSLTNEDVSVFLPTIIRTDTNNEAWLFGNEIVWANSFSNELGFIDFESLMTFMDYTLSGAVFNRADFLEIGGFKESMSFMYTYEFLLRLTSKKLKAFVVPKEGYVHIVDRDGSMLTELAGSISESELEKWKSLALKEYTYTEDRNNTIESVGDQLSIQG